MIMALCYVIFIHQKWIKIYISNVFQVTLTTLLKKLLKSIDHVQISGPLWKYKSWQMDEETMETMRDFIFLDSKITADGDCSQEIRRCLLLGSKAMTKLGSVLKSRDITLPTKVCIIKAMVFPVVMYGCESWTIKQAEHWRIYAFELWCCRRLLRVSCIARRSNQSILKEINPEYKDWCWSWNSNILATWCEELTH